MANTTKSKATYKQIESSLRGKIRQGQWPVGTMLPSRRDLAREYGVSPITVERAVTRLVAEGLLRAEDRRGTVVLHTESPIPSFVDAADPENRANVYHPLSGGIASNLAPTSVRTGAIGIIAPLYPQDQGHLELNNYWMRLVVQSMEHVFSREGKTTYFFNRVEGPGQPLIPISDAIDAVQTADVDALAIITWSMDPRAVDEALAAVNTRELPLISITTGELRCPVPHILYENESAGYQVAHHLLQQQKEPILFVTPFMASWVKERLAGIQTAVEYAGLPADAVQVYPRRTSPWVQEEDPQQLGYQTAKAAFAEGLSPRSVICASDGVAFGFLQAASEAGKMMGRDFLLVGFDDHPLARSLHLTTLRPPMEAMGQEAARLLLRSLHGEEINMQVRMRGQLIPRASTRDR